MRSIRTRVSLLHEAVADTITERIMAQENLAEKEVLVQLGERSRVIKLPADLDRFQNERDALLAAVRRTFADQLGPSDKVDLPNTGQFVGGAYLSTSLELSSTIVQSSGWLLRECQYVLSKNEYSDSGFILSSLYTMYCRTGRCILLCCHIYMRAHPFHRTQVRSLTSGLA